MLTQAGLVQAARQMLDQAGHVAPGEGLPDAVFFFAHGRIIAAPGGVL
jgi:hypothetical protein